MIRKFYQIAIDLGSTSASSCVIRNEHLEVEDSVPVGVLTELDTVFPGSAQLGNDKTAK